MELTTKDMIPFDREMATNKETASGFEMTSSWDQYWSSTESYTNATATSFVDDYNCDVWRMPSRVALQVFCLATILLNIAAATVVFGVPIHVRGKHVSFLFVCVRLLNLLDIWQCVLLFFVPLFIPKDCNPSIAFCDATGYLFTSVTLFSPLVAIVMAVDRAIAVYFHVQYKANPQTKIKYISLISLLGFYGIYLLLPCFTNFGSYVAVPWLSLCSFEWGITSRTFDLILASITLVLIAILIAANIAILVKMKMRKIQIARMKQMNMKEQKKKLKEEKKFIPAKSFQLQKLHKSADDIIDISSNDCSTFSPTSSRLSKRIGDLVPPALQLHDTKDYEECDERILNTKRSTFSPNHCTSQSITPSPNSPRLWKYTWGRNKRPQSMVSPNTTTSMLSADALCVSTSSRQHSPSPLLFSPDKGMWNIPESKSRSLKRSSSADNIISSGSPSKFTFSKQNTPPLLRRVLDYRTGKLPQLDNQSSCNTGSSDENDTPRGKSANVSSSFFSVAFFATRGSTKRIKKQRKSRIMKKNVSKITKMTTTICLVFVIFYFPFMIRKMIQLIPSDYATVRIPPGVEIATLFGPLLSPLCNPIIYVFLNPHYKRHCIKLLKKVFQSCSTRSKRECCVKVNISKKIQLFKNQGPGRKQSKRSRERDTVCSHSSLDDVFLPDNSTKNQRTYELGTTSKNMENKHLMPIKPFKGRTASAL